MAKSEPLMPNYGAPVLQMDRGQGAYLYDTSGKPYLDFTSGIGVCNLGHAHSAIARTIAEQAHTLLHISNLFGHPNRTRLAERLAAVSDLDQVLFCNSGTEANEAALKLARRYAWTRGKPHQTVLVSLPGGFHGRTFGSLSVTPKAAYHDGYRPLLPDCFTPAVLEEVVDAITEETAGCIVEVIQGEGGVRTVPPDLLYDIEAKCRDVGALFMIDEVQTGVGRTGKFFAYQHLGLQPDVVTVAKGLGNGVPIGAVITRSEIAAAFTPGSHGSTFGGNPLAMAAANRVLDYVTDAALLTHVQDVGEYLGQKLKQQFEDVSGMGLMWGFNVANAAQFASVAADRGLLVTTAGATRIRLLPPLIIDKAHVDEAIQRLKETALQL